MRGTLLAEIIKIKSKYYSRIKSRSTVFEHLHTDIMLPTHTRQRTSLPSSYTHMTHMMYKYVLPDFRPHSLSFTINIQCLIVLKQYSYNSYSFTLK